MSSELPSYERSVRERSIDAVDSQRRGRSSSRVKPFAIYRPLAHESARRTKTHRKPKDKNRPGDRGPGPETFQDLLYLIPSYSDYAIPVPKGGKASRQTNMWLLHKGMVEDVIANPRSEITEQKEANRLAQSIVDSVNGRGSKQAILSHEMLKPLVISTEKGFMGYLAVRDYMKDGDREEDEYDYFDMLKTANVTALQRLESIVPGYHDEFELVGRALQPWMKLAHAQERDAAEAVVNGFHDDMRINEVSLILDAARPLLPRSR